MLKENHHYSHFRQIVKKSTCIISVLRVWIVTELLLLRYYFCVCKVLLAVADTLNCVNLQRESGLAIDQKITFWKFHKNPSSLLWEILQTNKQRGIIETLLYTLYRSVASNKNCPSRLYSFLYSSDRKCRSFSKRNKIKRSNSPPWQCYASRCSSHRHPSAPDGGSGICQAPAGPRWRTHLLRRD